MADNADKNALSKALNTPLDSPERRALEVKWAGHYGHDGTIHLTITTGCRFGSALRDDVCHPRVIPPGG